MRKLYIVSEVTTDRKGMPFCMAPEVFTDPEKAKDFFKARIKCVSGRDEDVSEFADGLYWDNFCDTQGKAFADSTILRCTIV